MPAEVIAFVQASTSLDINAFFSEESLDDKIINPFPNDAVPPFSTSSVIDTNTKEKIKETEQTETIKSFIDIVMQKCKSAFKQVYVVGLILQFLTILCLVSFYTIDSVYDTFMHIAKVQEKYGFIFASLVTSFFGGFVGFLFAKLLSKSKGKNAMKTCIFLILFWALRGLDVYAFFRLQVYMFGTEISVKTVAQKCLFDSLVYSPYFGTPITYFAFIFVDADFSYTKMKKMPTFDSKRELLSNLAAMQASSWTIWAPVGLVSYVIPPPLQIALFNLVLVLYVIVVSLMTGKGKSEKSDANFNSASVSPYPRKARRERIVAFFNRFNFLKRKKSINQPEIKPQQQDPEQFL